MAKKFSIVEIEDNEIFLTGWKNPEDLPNSVAFLKVMGDISSYSNVKVTINHCLFLDFPGELEDISAEDLNIILNIFDELVEKEHIYLEENIIFEMKGLKEEQIIEESV